MMKDIEPTGLGKEHRDLFAETKRSSQFPQQNILCARQSVGRFLQMYVTLLMKDRSIDQIAVGWTVYVTNTARVHPPISLPMGRAAVSRMSEATSGCLAGP